jgi:hypothetical protein
MTTILKCIESWASLDVLMTPNGEKIFQVVGEQEGGGRRLVPKGINISFPAGSLGLFSSELLLVRRGSSLTSYTGRSAPYTHIDGLLDVPPNVDGALQEECLSMSLSLLLL